MAILTVVNNPFNFNDKTTSIIEPNKKVFEYLDIFIKKDDDLDFVISINGVITEQFTQIIRKNDCLVVVPIVGKGGGGKNVLRVVAMIGLSFLAPYAAGYLATGLTTNAAVWGVTAGQLYGTAAAIGYAASAAVMVGGGMLINTLLPPPVPKIKSNNNLQEISPTYSFSGGSNAKAVGTTLPIMIGMARVIPPVIGSYLSLNEDKQYLNILMAVNDGKVDNIKDIQINEQSINNFKNCTFEIRKGENNQSVISGFRNSPLSISLAVNLNETKETTYTTKGNSVQELEIVMNLPRGHYKVQDNGNYVLPSAKIIYKIEYKKSSDSNFKEFKTININNVYKTAKKMATTLENLEKSKYDIRVTRISSYSKDTRTANDLQLDYINEIVYDDFTYPNTALLSVKAMATDQLNGGFPKISCIVDNTKTRDNNKLKNNPAWACYDLLKRENIPDSDINLTKFNEWATYCQNEGFTSNLYLDSQQELQSALNMVSILGRATVVQMGSIFTPIVSNKVDTNVSNFLFTGANIIDSSFSLDNIPHKDRANIIEITYYDEKDNYKAKSVQVQSEDFDSKTADIKSSISLYGCTKREIALRYAKFLLNQNRYITEKVTFEAHIDSIACSVGDVIDVGVKHMTNTMCDGRVVDADSNSITLDKEINLKKDKEYELQYRTLDDKIHILTFSSSEDLTTNIIKLNVSVIPQKHDIFAIGNKFDKATNLYRVTSITRASDLKRKITAIEYNASVYDDNASVQIEKVLIDNTTRNLRVEESLIQNLNSVDEIISISWQANRLNNDIFIDDKKVGSSDTNTFILKNVLNRGQTYKIRVNEKEITYKYEGRFAKVEEVETFNVSLSDTSTFLTWNKVDFSNGYRLYHNDNLIEDKIMSTTYNYRLLKKGLHKFKIEALNLANEPSDSKEISVSVEVPLNPIVNITYDGENIVLNWHESNSTYSIKHYIIKHDKIETISKTTTYQTKVNWIRNDILVQAVDINDNVSSEIVAKSIITPPLVKNLTSRVIDNNILLFWDYDKQTLPIKEVEIRVGDDLKGSKLAGFNTGTFASFFENKKGNYKYWFIPIDTANNKGVAKSIVSFVNEPPDYILNVEWKSDFNSIKNNAIKEDNYLLMNIDTSETWEEHFINNNFNSVQEQINSDYEYYLQPNKQTAYYEEIFDYGSILPFTGITVTIDYEVVNNSNYSIDIFVSKDKKSWKEFLNTSRVFVEDFQFLKVRVNTTSDDKGFLKLTQIDIRLDNKLKNEAGKGFANKDDKDGTLINIKQDFIDIVNLNITPIGTIPMKAIVDFKDVPHANSFKVFIFDEKNGQRLNSKFTYLISGY